MVRVIRSIVNFVTMKNGNGRVHVQSVEEYTKSIERIEVLEKELDDYLIAEDSERS